MLNNILSLDLWLLVGKQSGKLIQIYSIAN